MFILGNFFHENDSSFVIVISSKELSDYTYLDKINIIDNVTIFRYKIEIKENESIKLGKRIINIPDKKPQINNTSIYFVSCDGQDNFTGPVKVYNIKNKKKDSDMWKKLYMDIKNDTNDYKYVIHIGDQVYMDDANDYIISSNLQNDDNAIKKTYYRTYKENFNKKYKKKVLETAYNIMIQDDHEFNDYGALITNKLNLSKKMVKNLNLMYVTFQENLYGINNNSIIKHLQFKDFQIIIPNVRKYRKPTTSVTKFPVMGKKQINELNKIISNTSNKIKKTFYVNSVPFVSVNKYIDKIYSIIEDPQYRLEYYFSSDSYQNERYYVINKLFHLDNVVIVAGDYHMADFHVLEKNKKKILHITTSPISSTPLFYSDFSNYSSKLKTFFALTAGTIISKLIYERDINDIEVKKKWFVNDFNYLKVTSEKATLKCYFEKNDKNIPW